MTLKSLAFLLILGLGSVAEADEISVAVEAPSDDRGILTPPAPETPRINGPSRFGVRPNSPFLYAIPATGERPMTFSVDQLPSGLTLDAATGQITGSLTTSGTYPVVFRAKNNLGSAERTFQIVAGDEISLTPPMGWNSWNCWAEGVDQEKVLRSAKALVDSGLNQHGWNYVNMDDTWQGMRTGPDHALLANEKFPDMKGLGEAIHGMGLRMGIYSTPWITSYAGFTGGSADNPDGYWSREALPHAGRRIGSHSFSVPDARQWAAWGVDYLKYDWLPNRVPETKDMADALRSSGRDIVFSLSNDAPFEGAAGYTPLANCWRITGDITDNWNSLVHSGFNQTRWEPYAKPGHWNDPDMLIVGRVGWGKTPHPTHLTPDEQYTHISLWCLLAAPLLLGCDLEKLDHFTLGLLTNDEVLAVDQDALGRQATRVSGDDTLLTDIYAKPMEDGTWAVGLFNRGKDAATVKALWSDLHLLGPQPVRDLWRQKDLGTFKDEFSTTVPSHGIVLVRIGTPAPP